MQKIEKPNSKGIRLNRYISLCGIGSRRRCEQFILDGRVTVNQSTVTELFTVVKKGDEVHLDGEIIKPKKPVYILMNKPAGTLTTLHDPRGRKHVGQLLKRVPFVKPIGRLDMNTTGVLLFTNDGELLYRLTHPKYQIVRTYVVTIEEKVSFNVRGIIEKGVELGDGKIAHIKVLKILHRKTQSILLLELTEGMYREIRRVFKILGYKVKVLDRISYAGISYGVLKRGKWRYLSSSEMIKLKEICNF